VTSRSSTSHRQQAGVGCAWSRLRLRDVAHAGTVGAPRHRPAAQDAATRAVRADRPDRESVAAWITHAKLRSEAFLFPSRVRHVAPPDDAPVCPPGQPLVAMVGWIRRLRSAFVRRTKATLIYRRTKNLAAVQLLLGHRKLKAP